MPFLKVTDNMLIINKFNSVYIINNCWKIQVFIINTKYLTPI